MAAGDQQTNSTGVSPGDLQQKERKPSWNPFKGFKNSGARSSSSKPSEASANEDNSRSRPPLVVNYFPTANRPSLK